MHSVGSVAACLCLLVEIEHQGLHCCQGSPLTDLNIIPQMLRGVSGGQKKRVTTGGPGALCVHVCYLLNCCCGNVSWLAPWHAHEALPRGCTMCSATESRLILASNRRTDRGTYEDAVHGRDQHRAGLLHHLPDRQVPAQLRAAARGTLLENELRQMFCSEVIAYRRCCSQDENDRGLQAAETLLAAHVDSTAVAFVHCHMNDQPLHECIPELCRRRCWCRCSSRRRRCSTCSTMS